MNAQLNIAKDSNLLSRSSIATVLLLGAGLFSQNALANARTETAANLASNPFSSLSEFDPNSAAPGDSASSASSVARNVAVGTGFQVGGTTAEAFATEGSLKASIFSSAATVGGSQNAVNTGGYAFSRWTDSFTIDAGEAFRGRNGFIAGSLSVDGYFRGRIGPNGPNDNSSVSVVVRIGGTGIARGDTSSFSPVFSGRCGDGYCGAFYAGFGEFERGGPGRVGTATNSNIPTTILLDIPVTFGAVNVLDYSLRTEIDLRTSTFSGGFGTSADGIADYGHTLTWGGISGVFDSAGNAITTFTTTSASGFDYLQAPTSAVPAPAAVWLIVSALPLLFRRRGIRSKLSSQFGFTASGSAPAA